MNEKILFALVTSTETRFTADTFVKVFCPSCGCLHTYQLGPTDDLLRCMFVKPASFVFRRAHCDLAQGLFLIPPQYVFSGRKAAKRPQTILEARQHVSTEG